MRKYCYLFLSLLVFIAFALAKPQEKKRIEWIENLDYGPFIATCLSEKEGDQDPILKGLVLSIGKKREIKIVYDTALLQVTGAWDGKIYLQGTPWDGKHGGNPEVEGEKLWWSKKQPGWAINGSTADPREIPYGNLPKNNGRYKGCYRDGETVVLKFIVEGETIFESPELIEIGDQQIIARHFNVPTTGKGLTLLVTDIEGFVAVDKSKSSKTLNIGNNAGLKFESETEGRHLLKLPADQKDYKFSVYYSKSGVALTHQSNTPDLSKHLQGGPAHWPKTVELQGKVSNEQNAYVVDEIPIPETNPYGVVFRSGGFDFFADGKSAAFCTWNGDVWIVTGIDDKLEKLTWKRYASGLFETLGLKIVDDLVYVTGKDQITRLHDLNGDGEADYYECFNNDIMITKNFHEFTFDLQTDPDGNFYFAKAAPVKAGGRGFDVTTPNHGVVFKVSKDGQTSEVYASGLRAPGGMGVGPNGEVTTGENEGTYVPACKINWATKGSFHGVIHPGNGKTEAEGYDLPVCWLPMWADNSGGGQVWVPDDRWGNFKGDMLHLSYGQCALYKVMKEEVEGQVQGGVSKIPIKLSSSAMRARFNSQDGQLYILGFAGWQTNAANLCGFQRIRYTGNSLLLPRQLETFVNGVKFTFTDKLDKQAALDPGSYKVSRFNYLYSSQYGSGTYSLNSPQELIERGKVSESKRFMSVKDLVFVKSVSLMDDGYSVFLELADMQKANQIEYELKLKSAKGQVYDDKVYQTVHRESKREIQKDRIVESKLFKEEKIDWDKYQQGLVSSYTQNDKKVDQTVVRMVANRFTKDELPALNLKQEPYVLEYEGYIYIKEVGSFQLLFDESSKLTPDIQIGTSIIRYITPSHRLKSNELLPVMSLPIGLHKFKITKLSFQAQKDYRFRLLWKWEGKALEPIPSEVFFHETTPELNHSLSMREGRELLGTKQCTACHELDLKAGEGMPELWERAPDLNKVGARLNADWMQAWLLDPKALRHNAKMPSLFKGDAQKAAHVATYLSELAANEKVQPFNISDDLVKKGGGLFNDLGCIACHSSPSNSNVDLTRMPLDKVSIKYQPQGLVEFLLKPEANHRDTRMPNFGLKENEAKALASFLLTESLKTKSALNPLKGDAVQGKQIMVQMGCANCHEVEGIAKINAPELAALNLNSTGCLESGYANYQLQLQERDALKLALKAQSTLAQHVISESSLRAMKQLNCVACHERDGQSDLWSKYSVETKVWAVEHTDKGHLAQDRPSLTNAGEKLNTAYIHQLLKGTLDYNARPWLLAKMPAFVSRAERISLGLASQHGMSIEKDKVKQTKDGEKTGHQLTGVQGFSCIVCHGVGQYKPLAAFEVEGINLSRVADRLRPAYYKRWMFDPIRVDSKTKMPRYSDDGIKTGLGHILEGDAESQFDALWQYLQKGMAMEKPVGMQ